MVKLISSTLILITLFLNFACSITKENSSVPAIGPNTDAIPIESYHQIFYISKTTGSDQTGDGSKEHPYQSLQFALSQISDASSARQYAILVAEGVYTGETIKMKPHVDLFGGFEPSTWQRDIFRQRTILSGENLHRVISGADNARLDGFFITKGQTRGKGAAMVCDGVSPTITNNIFSMNKTQAPVPWDPKYRHEIANDGGAIYCENGASPIIEHNIFADNATEIGRGAAIALHKNCAGRIANNLFLNNQSGLNDPMRSSDGGAISVFDWSSPTIENNIFLNNRALSQNDGGAVFVALWSSPNIRRNIFVGNQCTDDAGALFVGGQEHRYDRLLDLLPDSDKFFVAIDSNVFIGNSNPSKNSGAMRFTMESRGRFAHNIVAHNSGIYFQRCEAVIENNIILDDFQLIETKAGLQPCTIKNNIIWGEFLLRTVATVIENQLKADMVGNTSRPPNFIHDWLEIRAESVGYNPRKFVTHLFVSNLKVKTNELRNRIVRSGDLWGVVKSNDANTMEIWGDFSGCVNFTVLPTYRLK